LNNNKNPIKIWLVSTELKVGFGGISTALLGFIQSDTFKKHDVNVIISHASSSKFRYWINAIFTMLNEVKSGDIVWLHCGNWLSTLRKLSIALIAKAKGAKVVFHMHEPMDKPIENWSYRALIKCIDLTANGLIFITDWGQRLVERKMAIGSPIAVIANPFDKVCETALESPASYENSTNIINILSMARIEEDKGFALVVETAKYLPDNFKIKIAGDGPFLEEIKRLILLFNLSDKIELLGWVDYQDKHQLIASSDVFFLPSKLDSFGMCYLEAMSFGLPIVALNFGAIPYVVKDNVTGLLSNKECPRVLAKAIESAYQRREYLGTKGKAYVKNKYSPELLSQQLLSFIKEL